MSSAVVQLLVLAGIAIFLILKLKNVLGTREGFEKPPVRDAASARSIDLAKADLQIIEGGLDRDIIDHVKPGSTAAQALAEMKKIEPQFSLGEFLKGARSAYEMILMAFERGDLASVRPFLAEDVHDAFAGVVADRERRGLKVEATFVGLREIAVTDAEFDPASGLGEVTLRFVGEQTKVTRNAAGEIVEGNANEILRQRDVWTFARTFGSNDPNWQLVATAE